MRGTGMQRERQGLRVNRRSVMVGTAAVGGTLIGSRWFGLVPITGAAAETSSSPALVASDSQRPQVPCGVMSGDPSEGRAIIWSKADRPARMLADIATSEDFRNAKRISGPAALASSDYTARIDLSGLPAGAELFYRVTFQDLADAKTLSAPATGRLRVPGAARQTELYKVDLEPRGR